MKDAVKSNYHTFDLVVLSVSKDFGNIVVEVAKFHVIFGVMEKNYKDVTPSSHIYPSNWPTRVNM